MQNLVANAIVSACRYAVSCITMLLMHVINMLLSLEVPHS
jgi:hypothetical protein